jgi:hypothetical protein
MPIALANSIQHEPAIAIAFDEIAALGAQKGAKTHA